MIVRVDAEGRIPLQAFADIVDIEQVRYYRFSENNGKIVLEFFDGGQNQLPLKKTLDKPATADISLKVTNNCPKKG